MLSFRLIAFDSMGARSMATVVETKDVKIFIDPSVALAPRRFGLPPHDREVERMYELSKVIEEEALDSDVIIVTHYHYDHFDLGHKVPLKVYEEKDVLIKHPKENINRSQRVGRAPLFLKSIEGLPNRIEFADGKEFRFGSTSIRFSRAVPHGTNTRLGYVIEVLVESGGERFLFSSDVEGPSLDEQVRFIEEADPHIAVIDGPMTYMLGFRYSRESLRVSEENLRRILDLPSLELLVLDHHFCRELEFRERVPSISNMFKTAAEASGRRNELLEAMRRELYGR
ncbi:MAG: MBL fold metallo-hydrolase [Candidatus Korarchaeota archaeon]|nr:MBL fold metallo-hydrolase [Candidatus Korarchaeota archaeon]